jgi:hypothetical protein
MIGGVKKRSFLLLEVLIALLFVSLCIAPMMQAPLAVFKKERKNLEQMEKERLADWSFSEVKERLLKNEIPWEKIPKQYEETGPFPLPDVKIELPGYKPKTIKRIFTLYGQGKKEGKGGQDLRQLYVRIFLDGEKEKYEFRLPAQKG